MFFKKHDNNTIQNAYQLMTPEGEITEENHTEFSYPTLAGWYWFDTPEAAYSQLSIGTEAVTSLQGMLAIKQAGLVEAFQTWLSTLDPVTDFETLAYFQRAPVWHQDNSILLAGATAMGLTETQLNDLFTLAKTLG